MTTCRVVCIATASRFLIGVLGGLSDSLAADYDTSSGLQALACSTERGASASTPNGLWFQPKFVWDSVFFTRIALCGYEYEQFFAFFPLLPVQAIHQSVSPAAALATVAPVLSLAAFVTSAVNLHKLSNDVLQDSQLADLATILYVWNPASVFYSAPYTESIFACTAFIGLYHLNKQPWLAGVVFCAASATRSNGILHCWFVLHRLAKMLLQHCPGPQDIKPILLLTQAALQCMLICLPVLAFQYYGWQSLCRDGVTERPWCSARLPNVYSFVQSHYWGVGLFRYFTVQQIPNFMLAMPMLYLSVAGCWTHFNQNWNRAFLLGLDCPPPKRLLTAMHSVQAKAKNTQKPLTRYTNSRESVGFNADSVSPYIYQWALMTACALFVMNVQVATRFLSACPALYWYSASLVYTAKFKWIWGYFMLYFCLGSVLFQNFYPWT